MQRQWALTALVAGGCIAATIVGWHVTKDIIESKRHAQFVQEVELAEQAIRARLTAYEQVLWGGVGLFNASSDVKRDEWRRYVQALNIAQRLPGIQGVGFATTLAPEEIEVHMAEVRAEGLPGYAVRPAGERSIYTSILYLEPLDWRNERALGYDMFSEPVRRVAMARARDTGKAALSGKVVLVQETDVDVQAGFLMYVPLYWEPSEPEPSAHSAHRGYVYSPFRALDFLREVARDIQPGFHIVVHDGTTVLPETEMARISTGRDTAMEPPDVRIQTHMQLEFGGQVWTLAVSSTPSFLRRTARSEADMVLIGGLVAGLGFAGMTALLARYLRKRRKAERNLQGARQQLRGIIAQAPIGVYVADGAGRLLFANERYAQTLGLTPDDLIGRTGADICRSATGADVLLEAGQGTGGMQEIRIRHPDGGERVLLSMTYALPGHDGVHAGICGFVLEVTEQKKVEAQLRQAQKMEAVGQLTGGIAHDFNNILQAIIGNAEILVLDASDATIVRASAQRINEIADRAASLIQRLMSFSRIQILEPSTTDLNAAVRSVEDLLSRTLGSHIKVRTSLDQPSPLAFVDRAQLDAAIVNLAVNARDAMPEGGSIVVRTGYADMRGSALADKHYMQPGRYAVLAVSDAGCGMPAEVVQRVFEPFFTTKPVGKGSGLGLSMVYGFVKQSDGYVCIESQVGEGTTVTMYLQPSDALARTEPAPHGEECLGASSPPEKVLVVEDDPGVRKYMVRQLLQLGYGVVEADDGPSALGVARQNPDIDLLLSDVVLTGSMSGPHLADALLADRPALRVLFASGFTDHAMLAERTLSADAAILRKPFRGAEMARAVRHALS